MPADEPNRSQKLYELLKDANGPACRQCLLEIMVTRYDGNLSFVRHTMGWEVLPGRNRMLVQHCPRHGMSSHLHLTGERSATHTRQPYPAGYRERIRKLFGGRDAYTLQTATNFEVDHRIPIQTLPGDEPSLDWDDEQTVVETFMLLSAEHNTIKRWKCDSCQKHKKRPPFIGVSFWYEGDSCFTPEQGCHGCGWAFPERWRAALHAQLPSTQGGQEAL